eukprot:scaffold255490_cov33-Tisochrysis_lutea.AAC.1
MHKGGAWRSPGIMSSQRGRAAANDKGNVDDCQGDALGQRMLLTARCQNSPHTGPHAPAAGHRLA